MSDTLSSFRVDAFDESRRVEVVFGSETDVRGVGRWRASRKAPQAVRDALEFARLASKRWRYYRRSIPTILSIQDFQNALQANPRAEISFILLAQAPWFSDKAPLGLAQCRRTFCNHVILEFLAVHPRILEGAPRVFGIGTGIVHSLAGLATYLKVPLLWGESTEISASFYRKLFDLPELTDHFFVRRERLETCVQKFRSEAAGQLSLETFTKTSML